MVINHKLKFYSFVLRDTYVLIRLIYIFIEHFIYQTYNDTSMIHIYDISYAYNNKKKLICKSYILCLVVSRVLYNHFQSLLE